MSYTPPSCLPEESPATWLTPIPANLDYSFGLPAGAYCLAMARAVVGRLLTDHGLPDMSEIGTFAASELLANANQFTPGRNANLSMRWRFGVLRLTVFDEHPAHSRRAQQACQARRREALSMLDAVVGACGGIVGLDDAGGPLAGSKMWVAISREAARTYAAL
ncbi:ATP-binding protein [Streptomyces morookaense]|uniref:ATP-binding protein n=1 Tax=Streptomyces morookaense TaxID=1970 RepID=UPI0033D10978